MLLRRLHLLLLALMLFAAGAPASAKVYQFAGKAVGDCTLSGSTYTCPSLPLPNWNDGMTIASGYTVNITSDATFGYSQSLSMSGTAVLSSTGNLDIGGITTNSLDISGGTLIAGGTFSVGAQNQTLTADIRAATANLGTGSTLNITGNVTATGNVNIASHATITGTIRGVAVTTNSPVALTGDIVATNSFTLASGSTVKGNVTAPIVSLLAASSTVTGNITAKTSLQLGSSVGVTGDVATGTLTLDDSNAIINGNATVDSAVLNWAGRVTKLIYCTGGTTPGQCDCVTNNSGYPVNTVNGPHCQGKTLPLDHLQIDYDPAGSVCAPSTVTVTACANAACTSTYGGGTSVTVVAKGPGAGGQTTTTVVAVGASGMTQASVNYPQAGSVALSATSSTATASAMTCRANGSTHTTAGSCPVSVTASAYVMTLDGASGTTGYVAESARTLTVSALSAATAANGSPQACTPMFKDVKRGATFTCAYANPTTGFYPVRLNGKALNAAGLPDKGKTCDSAGQALTLSFDANGNATLPLQYADVGKVTLTITDSNASSPPPANLDMIFAPAAFTVGVTMGAAPYVAARTTFDAKVTAVNGANVTTPNFGRESPQQTVALGATGCRPATARATYSPQPSSTVSQGVVTFSGLTYAETGSLDVDAALTGGSYLGTGLSATGTTNTNVTPGAAAGCTGAAGTFIPAYFTIATDTTWTRKATLGGSQRLQYYSGERSIQLTITARNAVNGITANYTSPYARQINLTAFDGASNVPLNGTFSRSAVTTDPACTSAQLCPAEFNKGSATWTGSYTFAASPTGQTLVRVRATGEDGATSGAIPAGVSPEPVVLIRSGRVRLTNGFGGMGNLDLPVSLEYYTGQTWVRNAEDSTTSFTKAAVAVGTGAALCSGKPALTAFANGMATLCLAPSGTQRGSVPYAINLGTTNGANASCYYNTAAPNMTDSTGAKLAFLRSGDASCKRNSVDPSALATFGIYAPDARRVIHVREVFR